ncbi:MAG TPA: ATP F0F1 synthase subunit B [Caulobacteraceae bacterium]|nr:ATP F0F1 synthase subunit B [Caulobacteraceae bacterium]
MSAFTNPQDAHFWVTIALVVFLVLLWRAKAPAAVGKALDAAGAQVKAQLDEAARLRDEAAQVLEQIRIQHQETEAAAARMLEEAKVEAELLRAEAAKRLEEDIRRRSAMAEQRIANAEAKAAQEVKAAAAEMAAEAAQAVFARRLAGQKTDPLVDRALDELPRRLA